MPPRRRMVPRPAGRARPSSRRARAASRRRRASRATISPAAAIFELARRLADDHAAPAPPAGRSYTSSSEPVPSTALSGVPRRGSGRAPATSPAGTRRSVRRTTSGSSSARREPSADARRDAPDELVLAHVEHQQPLDLAVRLLQHLVQRLACARVRGNRRAAPRAARRAARRALSIRTTSSSGTSSPGPCTPAPPARAGVLPAVLAQHVAGRDVRHAERPARRGACVPLPAPGGPKRIRSRATGLLQEALVVAHHELRLHLPHGVERHAHDDQDRGAAETAGDGLREAARSG